MSRGRRLEPHARVAGERRSLRRRPLVDGFLESRAGGELRDPRGRDLDLLAGGGVTALASAALRDAELAESGERHLAATLQGVLDGVEYRVDRVTRVFLTQPGAICDLVDELRLSHLLPPSRWYERSKLTGSADRTAPATWKAPILSTGGRVLVALFELISAICEFHRP